MILESGDYKRSVAALEESKVLMRSYEQGYLPPSESLKSEGQQSNEFEDSPEQYNFNIGADDENIFGFPPSGDECPTDEQCDAGNDPALKVL